MRIDLHVHSNASDGTDSPAEVMRRARDAGLDGMALTDHDIAPPPGLVPPDDLTLVTGMELSCLLDGESMHMLAYMFDTRNEALAAETERIRDDRVYRARAMVGRLAELGTAVTWEQVARIAGDAVVGRPHIARAMVAAGVVDEPADAFTPEWIADGGRAFVGKYSPAPAAAIALVRAAGGVCVLAHPRSPGYEVADEVIARLAAAGLAGLEVSHPDHDCAERDVLHALAADLSLVATGGSDDHGSLTGHRIGSEFTDGAAFEALASQAGGGR